MNDLSSLSDLRKFTLFTDDTNVLTTDNKIKALSFKCNDVIDLVSTITEKVRYLEICNLV